MGGGSSGSSGGGGNQSALSFLIQNGYLQRAPIKTTFSDASMWMQMGIWCFMDVRRQLIWDR